MPTKLRAAKALRPQFSRDVLELFIELEHAPKRGRGDAFKAKEKKLMYALGLVAEFWTMTSVLDRSVGPSYPPQFAAHRNWHTCRAIREALLAASGSTDAPKAAQ
jgi:hypothetical protein